MGIRAEGSVGIDTIDSFNIGNHGIGDLLDAVRWQAIRRSIPSCCATKSKSDVIDLVIDIHVESICATVHPSDVGIARGVDGDRGVETVSILQSESGVIDDDEVSVALNICGWAQILEVVIVDHACTRIALGEAGPRAVQ